MGYSESMAMRRNGEYFPVTVGRCAMSTCIGEPSAQSRTIGCSSARRSPRKVIGAMSSIGATFRCVGTKPCPE